MIVQNRTPTIDRGPMVAEGEHSLYHRPRRGSGSGGIAPGRLIVDRLPMLARHRGMPPDLIVRWNAMPLTTAVDVVVHLHGHSTAGARLTLPAEIEPRSGLDFADPDNPLTIGRRKPAVLILPRGNFVGGRSGRVYNFPALIAPGALAALIDDVLRRVSARTGAKLRRGRLILTAHSGGGSALMALLRHTDPDEVHAFDALYTDPAPLIAWVRRHQRSGTGALRVLYRAKEGTAANSARVESTVGRASPRFRVERTTVPHGLIPRRYGWRLLVDPGVNLPDAFRATGGTRASSRPQPGPSDVAAAIARRARSEFWRWRPSGGPALTETSVAASPILREYYLEGVHIDVTDAQMRSARYHAEHPWSAVFISYVVRKAGGGSAFQYSTGHHTYVRAARNNRVRQNRSNPFWAFRATEIAPRVGDIVCASRAGSGATYDNIAESRHRAMHCDIVTDVQRGRIAVVGGNVGNSVGEKWLTTQPDGRLNLDGRQAAICAIIRVQGDSRTLDSAAGPGPSLATERLGRLEDRVSHVMNLLVNEYRYPVNGAAGLVGNLMAESQIIPNRIEGSRAEAPMRAQDFSGRVRDFTPDEVRHRDYARRVGPKLPGVGLAQWTTKSRRDGLFRHVHRGQQLGSAILNNLDAQIDYLVTELGRSYRNVDVVLRRPTVTLADASDVVLLRFEIPASVVHRSVGDPRVQRVLASRRRNGQRVLEIYRSGRPR